VWYTIMLSKWQIIRQAVFCRHVGIMFTCAYARLTFIDEIFSMIVFLTLADETAGNH